MSSFVYFSVDQSGRISNNGVFDIVFDGILTKCISIKINRTFLDLSSRDRKNTSNELYFQMLEFIQNGEASYQFEYWLGSLGCLFCVIF